MVKFTVITICLNMEKELGNTISSVLNQTLTDYEYLIKDGVSRDGTVAVAETYASAFAEKNIPYRVISSADSGVYDAMNQAVREARGEWVIFMNAGDCLADKSVLKLVVESGCLEKADIVYGDCIVQNQNWYRYQKAASLETIRFALPFCHQSVFTRRELLETTPYALQYRICSDHRFYLQMYQQGKVFAYCSNAVSIYDTSGMSSDWKSSLQETIRILEEMPLRDDEAIRQVRRKLMVKEREVFMHKHLWKYIPKKLRQKRRAYMNRNSDWQTKEEFFGKEVTVQ